MASELNSRTAEKNKSMGVQITKGRLNFKQINNEDAVLLLKIWLIMMVMDVEPSNIKNALWGHDRNIN